MYSKSEIDLVKSRIDMVEFLEKRGVSFRQAGINLVALCPFPDHKEGTPSFNVRPGQPQSFHCFGCGKRGSILDLIMELEGYSFTGAMQEAAQIAGIELEDKEQDEDFRRRQRLYQMVEVAAVYFRRSFLRLPTDHPAKQNLAARRLLNPDNDEGYGGLTDEMVGYADGEPLLDLLLKAKFNYDEMITAGLAKRTESSDVRAVFRNRLTFTIYDTQGRPIGFSGRRLPPDDNNPKVPKYLNSPQTPLYNKSSALLNLHEARKEITRQQQVVVVEGNADTMAMKAIGISNVVATCGTAFAEGHVKTLNLLSAAGRGKERFEFVFCFDGDEAGVKAARTVFEKNKSIQLNSYVVQLTDKDPSDLRLHSGDDALREALGRRVSLIEFILQQELATWDVAAPEGRMGFINRSRDILAQVDSEIQKNYYMRKIASWTGTPLVEVQRYLSGGYTAKSDQQSNRPGVNSVQERLLAAALQFPQEYARLAAPYGIGPEHFVNYEDLATKVLAGNTASHEDPQISTLLHVDLAISDARREEAIRSLITSFLRMMYELEKSRVNANLASVSLNGDAEETLFAALAEQDKLKKKYAQTRR